MTIELLKIIGAYIRALQKDKGELTDRVRKLEKELQGYKKMTIKQEDINL